jgi:hypothetical protein
MRTNTHIQQTEIEWYTCNTKTDELVAITKDLASKFSRA